MAKPSDDVDAHYMGLALSQARQAQAQGEVPVGAVVVSADGLILGQAGNAVIARQDPTAHAEVLALRQAALASGNYRLEGATLYVTLEPCAMCAGALLNARISRLVYAAVEPKTGAVESVHRVLDATSTSHTVACERSEQVELEHESRALLQSFFQKKRVENKAKAIPLRDDCLRTPLENPCNSKLLPPAWGRQFWLDVCPDMPQLRIHGVDSDPAGSSDAVFFLHDWHSWSAGFSDWVAAFSRQGLRTVTLDLPGCGLSDKPKKASAHTLGLHTNTVLAWLAALQVRRVWMVCHPQAIGFAQVVQKTLQRQSANVEVVQVWRLPDGIARPSGEQITLPFCDKGYTAVEQAALKLFSAVQTTHVNNTLSVLTLPAEPEDAALTVSGVISR